MKIESFPSFTHLDGESRQEYESLISGLTQYSNFSYPSMKIWYDNQDLLQVSRVENGVVIFYDNADPKYKGYCVLGESVDSETFTSVLKFSQDHGCPALVHQPEFSIAGVVGSELFHIDEEGDYDEYLIDASALTRLESPELGKIRRKIGRFERETQGRNIDISVSETVDSSFRDNILKAIDHWDSLFGRKNDLANNEGSAITYSLDHFSELGLRVLTLKVDGEIFGVCIYSATTDGSQYVLNHLRTDYSVPFINEFVTRSMAQVAVENSVDYLNLEMDLGIDNLRYHKANFRPARMLKQYQLTNN